MATLLADTSIFRPAKQLAFTQTRKRSAPPLPAKSRPRIEQALSEHRWAGAHGLHLLCGLGKSDMHRFAP